MFAHRNEVYLEVIFFEAAKILTFMNPRQICFFKKSIYSVFHSEVYVKFVFAIPRKCPQSLTIGDLDFPKNTCMCCSPY